MRAEIARHKPAKGPLDAKLARGGLVDVEFLVHYLQLREGVGLVPDLSAAIAALVGAGLLPEAIIAAHTMMSRLLIAVRLLAPDAAIPPPAARAVLAKACGCRDWDAILAGLAAARTAVSAAWAEVFGEKLEI